MEKISTVVRSRRALFPLLIGLASTGCRSEAPGSAGGLLDSRLSGDPTSAPGCVSAVYARDGARYRSRGLADLEAGVPIRPSTPFYVASVSKQFTAFAVAILIERGMVDPSESVGTYVALPRALGQISIGALIHMQDGIPDFFDTAELAGWAPDVPISSTTAIEAVRRGPPPSFEEGAEYRYSNSAYLVLAELVESVTGGSLATFLEAEVFSPLGMTSTRFLTDPRTVVPGRARAYFHAAGHGFRADIRMYGVRGPGGLFTTVEDIGRWYRYLLSGAPVDGAPQWERVSAPAALADGTPTEYGFGIATIDLDGTPAFGHSGGHGGYRSSFILSPEAGVGGAVLCNRDVDAHALNRAVLLDALGAEASAPGSPLVPPPPPPDELLGFYRTGGGTVIELVAEPGGLALVSPLGEALLTRSPDGTWTSEAGLRIDPSEATSEGIVLRTGSDRIEAARLESDLDMPKGVAGAYIEPRSGVLWVVLETEDGPVLERGFAAGGPRRPVGGERLAGRRIRVRVLRDSRGAVSALAATLGTVEDLRLERVPD